MKKLSSLSHFMLTTALLAAGPALAQENVGLHVVKYDINAELENAELCLEFDKTLAPATASHLSSVLKLSMDGKSVTPDNIAATGTSLCLFPLERSKNYRLDVTGLRGAEEEKMSSPYKLAFTIPDRTPTLAFTGENGGVNGFDFYANPLTLRAVNVPHAKISIYRVTDISTLAHAWQDRAQTAIAPTESAYLAENKGQEIWHGENVFDEVPNATSEQQFSLREKVPDLAPGLYLIIADAGNGDHKPANKGLSPLAAVWFTNADFSLSAFKDAAGVHVFTTKTEGAAPKTDLHLIAVNKKTEQVADVDGAPDGVGLIPLSSTSGEDSATVIGIDKRGGIAFADVKNLPSLSKQPALGFISTNAPFVIPGENVEVGLSLAPSDTPKKESGPSLLRLSQADQAYGDFPQASFTQEQKAPFPAPPVQGLWTIHWQKSDGTSLADKSLRVTTNADMPHLEVTSQRDTLTTDGTWPITIKSLSVTGKPVPLVGGQIMVVWQKLDPATFGWRDYDFGTPTAILDTPTPLTNFLTDLDGAAQLHLVLPKPPQDRGLYQVALKVIGEADAGVEEAAPLVLPLKPDTTVIGIKPLAADARFPQNGIARFSLIGLSSEGKPRDVSGLSYQVYEEGRHFSWYQDEGRWKYRQAAQLRPIGGGALSVKTDGSSVLEWPVTAGNYRLEILDQGGKLLAQTAFSASWDSAGSTVTPVLPLDVTLPKTLLPGHEATAHVILPEAGMLTAVIADSRIRKIIHEAREKGDNKITFTPGTDWEANISFSFEATPSQDRKVVRRAEGEVSVTENKTNSSDKGGDGTSLVLTDPLPALVLHKDNTVMMSFGVINNGPTSETYHYSFAADTGLLTTGDTKGSFTLESKQSRALWLSLSATQVGTKDIRLEVTGAHTPHMSHSWTIPVLPEADALHSDESATISSKQSLLPPAPKPHAPQPELATFVSRRPTDGLGEILSYVLKARPFTTAELASSIDALRLWGGTMTQANLAPESIVSAKRNTQIEQLLRHQNKDGGFAPYRGADSTIDDTAAALTAFGPDRTGLVNPAKAQAISWIKQRLANTWVDEKERTPRAAAYAALAAADAVDAASLHYFSDTSSSGTLPPIAEINIAAAFKHIGDPNAAAFWIKKMLDQNGGGKTVPLLAALSATDALSSDDVHAAMTGMKDALSRGALPDIEEAAGLLRAIAADEKDAGKGHISNGNETRDVAGVIVLRGNDTLGWRNSDTQDLYATFFSMKEPQAPAHATEVSIVRHVYRMNGIELPLGAKPVHGEPYLVELKGVAPSLGDNEQVLLQDGSNALRPIGCPLSPKIDTLSFIPWLTPHSLNEVSSCTFSSHELSALLTNDSDNASFSSVYFAYIDTDTLSNLPPPRLRIVQ